MKNMSRRRCRVIYLFFFFFKSRFSRRKEAETSERNVATTVVRQPWKEKEALEDIFSGRRKRIIVGSVYKDISISHTTIILDPFPDFPLLICFPCSWTSSLDKKSIRNFRVWEFQSVFLFLSHWLQLFMINLWLFFIDGYFFLFNF